MIIIGVIELFLFLWFGILIVLFVIEIVKKVGVFLVGLNNNILILYIIMEGLMEKFLGYLVGNVL